MLDYTVPPLQFLIGGFDASQYLDSISLSVPMYEPGQALLWSGRFKVSNNLKARANGLTDNDFSEYVTPTRWRPYQAAIRLNIRGISSPVFRIENYRYNPQTGSGEGTLTQIPTAIDGDRPSTAIETTVSGNIGTAIDRLITASFLGATVQPGRVIAGDSGVLDVPLTTRNPWGDAVRLASLNWRWLTVNTSESIVSVNDASTIFNRSLEQVELLPDLAAIFQSVQKVIVTGARQVPDTTTTANLVNPATGTPTAPRPKIKKTQEFRPSGAVFPSLAPSQSPTLFEDKTIVYQYWDDDSIPELLPGFLFDIQSVTQSGINPYAPPPPDLNVPMQTITIKRQPLGFLFPSLGVNASLTVAEMIVESNLRKLTIKPLGVLFPSAEADATLTIEKRETLTTALIPPGTQLTRSATNANGTAQQYEARPKLEPQQPVATRPLKTEVLKGTAQISPLGWVPILNKPLVVDFGFLPDNARASMLANKMAVREQQRRDQVLVDMPIPIEWLTNGWPLLSQAIVGGNIYLMDGCALSISDGMAKFGFTGALVSRGVTIPIGGVPTVVQQPTYQIVTSIDAGIIIEAVIATGEGISIDPQVTFELDIQSGFNASIDAGLMLEAVITTSGGVSINPQVVFELDVSAIVPPVNDNFANRIIITGQNISLTASNVGATIEAGETSPIDPNIVGASVWWTWTPTASGSTTISLNGSDFDTVLAVYTGMSLANLTIVGVNDDNPTSGIWSELSFSSVAGTTYQIAVSGYDAETGNIAFQLNQNQ